MDHAFIGRLVVNSWFKMSKRVKLLPLQWGMKARCWDIQPHEWSRESTCIVSFQGQNEVVLWISIQVIRTQSPAGVHVRDLMRRCVRLGWNVNVNWEGEKKPGRLLSSGTGLRNAEGENMKRLKRSIFESRTMSELTFYLPYCYFIWVLRKGLEPSFALTLL